VNFLDSLMVWNQRIVERECAVEDVESLRARGWCLMAMKMGFVCGEGGMCFEG
jgi:hypothetical protein